MGSSYHRGHTAGWFRWLLAATILLGVSVAITSPVRANDTVRDQFRRRAIQRARLFGQVTGVAPAIVVDNVDPQKQGRVKVKFPWLKGDETTAWARLVLSLGETGADASVLPEVGDEVLCAFEHGDIRRPYVLGGLWDGSDVSTPCKSTQEGCTSTNQPTE